MDDSDTGSESNSIGAGNKKGKKCTDAQQQVDVVEENIPPMDYGDKSVIVFNWVHLHKDLLGTILKQDRRDCWAIALRLLLQFMYNKNKLIPERVTLDIVKFIEFMKMQKKKKLDPNVDVSVTSLKNAIKYLGDTGLEKTHGRKGTKVFTVKGLFISKNDATFDDIIDQLKNGPVGIIVDINDDFYVIKNEIYLVKKPSTTKPRHALIVMGWGRTKDNKKFAIVQNSWGIGWGNQGYARFMIEDVCHIFYGHKLI